MFTTSCFIRKNTPELRKRLEDLGYENRNHTHYRGEHLCTFTKEPWKDNKYRFEYMTFTIDDDFLENIAPTVFVDCDQNDDLFIAIAALNDETDQFQYFKNEDGVFRCDEDSWICLDDYDEFAPEPSKLTVEELIDYFKNKK